MKQQTSVAEVPVCSESRTASAASAVPRVLHVMEATLGGTLVYLDTIITAMAGEPVAFALAYATLRATPALEVALAKARAAGWQLFPVEMTREIAPAQDWRSGRALLRVYRQFRPDVVHCHSSKAGALSRLAAAAMPGRRPRVVYTPNSIAANLGRKYLLVERLLAPLTARMVPVTDSEAKELVDYKLTAPGRFHTVYPVVDCAQFAVRSREAARAALGLPANDPILVGVGRLTAQKGPFRFLRILQQVVRQMPSALGIWVGDGELRQEFLEAARAAGLAQHVRVAGWQDDVGPWLAASNLLLSTSEYESFGYMVAEALAMERPVVATDITGTCDIMQGEFAAYLYPKEDAECAANLVLSLLRSPELSSRVGGAGRRWIADRYSFAQMRRGLTALYTEMHRLR